MKILPLLQCVLFTTVGVALSVLAAHAQEKVLEKSVSEQHSLIILRKEVDYVAPSAEAVKDFLKHFPPGTTMGKPKHVYLFSFVLSSKGSNESKEVWSHKVKDYNFFSDQRPIFQLFDAKLEKDTFVVVYKEGGAAYANIVKNGAQQISLSLTNTHLEDDSEALGKIILSGVLQGSVQEGTIAVVLRKTRDETTQFVLKDDKWVKHSSLLLSPYRASSLWTKIFEDQTQEWLGEFAVHPLATQTSIEGDKATQRQGVYLSFHKTPFTPVGKLQPEKQQLLWRLFLPASSTPHQAEVATGNASWSGHFVVDEPAGLVYLAIAHQNRFWIETVAVDAQASAVPTPAEVDLTAAQLATRAAQLATRAIQPTPEMLQDLPPLQNIKLDKTGEELKVTLTLKETVQKSTTRQWSYNLKTRAWRQMP